MYVLCYYPHMQMHMQRGNAFVMSVYLSVCLFVCLSVCFSVWGITFEPFDIKTANLVYGCTMTISRSSLSIKVIKCKKIKVIKSPKTLEKQLKLSVKSHGQVQKGHQVQKGQIMFILDVDF